jgi:hypothetical protein
MKNSILISIVLISTLVACGKKENNEEDVSVGSEEAAVESGITMIGGLADDQSGSSLALKSEVNNPYPNFMDILAPKAYAANCSRAFFQGCSSGVKSISYDGCEIPGTSKLLDGEVALTYTDSTCSLANNGESVTRTYDIQMSGIRGGVIGYSSAIQKDYREEEYGGGGRITRTPSGWEIDILGRHAQLTFRNREIYNTSIRTLSPVEVTGSLSRTSRLINGGQIEVSHNKAEFTATMTPNNLQWTGSCCHPTSGTLDVVYSGNITGQAIVTFGSVCGQATVDKDGQSKSIQLSYCE